MPVFALPGSGGYPVQPVHVDDLARICVQSTHIADDTIIDGAGPETMSFDGLVRAIRGAVGARSPILHLPSTVISAASRALGLLVHDVVLTPEEIGGLTAGLLISHDPPLGRIAFSEWLAERSSSIGTSYANELQRHFAGSMRFAGRSPSACLARACRARLGLAHARSFAERVPIAPVGL